MQDSETGFVKSDLLENISETITAEYSCILLIYKSCAKHIFTENKSCIYTI